MPDARRESRRRDILASAMRIFAERGFARSTTKEIAAGAGVAEGTIYLYFKSKDDLLLTAFGEKVREFARDMRAQMEGARPFGDRLIALVEMHFAKIESDPALAQLLLLEAQQSTHFYTESVREVLLIYVAAVDTLLETGVEEGALRNDLDIPLTRRMLVGALREIELHWLLGTRDRSLSAQAAAVARTFLMGIAAAERGPESG